MNGSVIYDGLILQGGINVDTTASLEELTVYENGVYNPSEGKDGFSKVTVDVPAAVLDDITITENGHYTPPIGVDGYNDIVVTVPHPAPVLDDITITENGSYQPPTGVDGYDNITVNVPAPAPVLDDITITENGTYTPPTGVDGYDNITVNIPLPVNGIYKQTLSGLPSPIATFTGADAPIDSLKASIIGVQSGSGDPSPSNVRPITGWSSCEVSKCGKNRFTYKGRTSWKGIDFDYDATTGGIRVRGLATEAAWSDVGITESSAKKYNIHLTTGTYSVSGFTRSASGRIQIWYDDGTNETLITTVTESGGSFTINKSGWLYPRIYVADGSNVDLMLYIQVESGDTQTTFEPYSGNTYTIPFKDSSNNPITVYDGEIDISGGKLTVTHANIASYNGETINEPWISSEDVYTQGATPTTGAQVVYPLTTPLIYDFDPLALRSNGVTNISVDCGEVTECKYYSDTP